MNTVRKVLKRRGGQIWAVNKSATVCDALNLMVEKDIGAVLVMEAEKLLGIVSERDVARKITYKKLLPESTLVEKIMTTNIYTIDAEDTVETARALMTSHRVRHLPVMDEEKVIGVISSRDVVSEIIITQRQTIEFYKDIALDE